MELKAYLRILASKWWIVLLVFLMTYVATLALTTKEERQYESKTTYVVKLNSSFSNDRDLASAVDILSRRTEIATTYTIIANSRQIKRRAAEALGLTNDQRSDVSVSSQLMAGTNVVQISVRSNDPALARDFANAAGSQLATYTRDLYATYTLEQLDAANFAETPISPNVPLNLTLGGVIGLALGIGLALLAAYLQAPAMSVTNAGVLDEETGVYNRHYFIGRLHQELARSKRNRYPLAIALINADHRRVLGGSALQIRREGLRRVALLLAPNARDEDLLAYSGDATFAVLLPDLSAKAAMEIVERMRAAISGNLVVLASGDVSLYLHSSAGIAAYSGTRSDDEITPEMLLAQAEQALRETETAAYGKVCLASEAEVYERVVGAQPAVGM